MRILRSASIGSMRAWLPSRRSTAHQRGAWVITWSGQVRSGTWTSSCSWNGTYFWVGMPGGLLGVDHWSASFTLSSGFSRCSRSSATRGGRFRPRRGSEGGGVQYARIQRPTDPAACGQPRRRRPGHHAGRPRHAVPAQHGDDDQPARPRTRSGGRAGARPRCRHARGASGRHRAPGCRRGRAASPPRRAPRRAPRGRRTRRRPRRSPRPASAPPPSRRAARSRRTPNQRPVRWLFGPNGPGSVSAASRTMSGTSDAVSSATSRLATVPGGSVRSPATYWVAGSRSSSAQPAGVGSTSPRRNTATPCAADELGERRPAVGGRGARTPQNGAMSSRVAAPRRRPSA